MLDSSPTHRTAPRLVLLAAAVALAACAISEGGTDPEELPVLTLTEPTLEIGVVDGDDAYTFAAIESVRRLDDGSIAVSDAGATRISVFGEDGSFVRSWGGRGEGPGEFRMLSRVYRLGSDSLMAADNATARLSVYDLGGRLSRQTDGNAVSGDDQFRLDSWLYGRFWIDGALTAAERARVSAMLDRLPPPRTEPGYRVGLAVRSGDVWIREPESAGATDMTTWTRLDPDGTPSAVIQTPRRFTPLDVVGDEVLGRWLGAADVHFVRVYDLVATGTTLAAPEWLTTTSGGPAEGDPMPEDEFQALMVSTIKRLASAQEIHYSQSYSYTTAMDSLDIELPEGLGVAFAHADPRGWAALFMHPGADRLCGLAYGFQAPAGWVPGAVQCGPPTTPPTPAS